MMRSLLRYPFLPLGFALLVLLVGVLLHRAVDARLHQKLESELTILRDSNVTALTEWIGAHERASAAAAADPEVRQAATSLLRRADRPREQAPLRQELQRLLKPVLRHNDFDAFLLVRNRGVVFTSLPEPWGELPEHVVAMIQELKPGEGRLSPPQVDEVTNGRLDVPVMWACSPLPSARTQRDALCFTLDPRRFFARVLHLAKFARTGETYAFGQGGTLLSRSRFESDLEDFGLLAPGETSELRIRLRDPGRDLRRGPSVITSVEQKPLTRMATSALQGESGVDVDGYASYRGAPVVGAWVWLEPYELGVATELEVSEAYATRSAVRVSMLILFGILILTTLALAFGARLIERLQGKARRAERLGQYTLEERIGQGGMGDVYRAQHALLRRPTAVKVIRSVALDSATRVRFEREVQATAQLTHPNTIAIYDYGHAAGGVFYYAMEYLHGITLQELVQNDGPQPQERVLHILRQVCGSLAEAHQNGLVHRDIKPANIMLCQRGGMYDVVKVLDFGLVRNVDGSESLLTAAGALAGTPHYMAPEYITEPHSADARSDVYAVAAMAFYLLTGRLLFDGRTMVSVLTQHMTEAPPRPSSMTSTPIEPEFEALLLSCLDKDPERRPKDASELLEQLEQLATTHGMRWTQRSAKAWWQERGQTLIHREQAPFTTAPTLAVDLRGRFGRQKGVRIRRERRRQPQPELPPEPSSEDTTSRR